MPDLAGIATPPFRTTVNEFMTPVEPPAPIESATAPELNRKRRRRGRRIGCIVVPAILLGFLCYIGVFGGNVRVVEAGGLIRSSQLTGNGYEALSARAAGNSLQSVIETYHIKTLLNLRGGSMKDERYRNEVATCKSEGVDHIDDTFSARSLPPPEAMLKMLDTFKHARRPILVHCQAGSDRTGLACTIYANIIMKQPLDLAEASQLTWRYGHFSFSNTRPMNTFFDLYRANAHGLGLLEWIEREYPAVYARESKITR